MNDMKTLLPLLGYLPIGFGLVLLPEWILLIEAASIVFMGVSYVLGDPKDGHGRVRDIVLLGPAVGILDFLIFGGDPLKWMVVGISMFWLAGVVSLVFVSLAESVRLG